MTESCTRCGQRLLLLRPGRTVCERCRLNPADTPARPATAPVARQPSTCAGCGTDSFALADGHCMPCRHVLGLDARPGDMSDESWKQLARGYDH